MTHVAIVCLSALLLLVVTTQEAFAHRPWTIRTRTTALRSTSPHFDFWEVYIDENGISHQRKRTINGFTFNQESSESIETTEQGCLSLPGLWKSDRVPIGSTATVFLTLVPGNQSILHHSLLRYLLLATNHFLLYFVP